MTRPRGVEIRLVLYVLCLLLTKHEVLRGVDTSQLEYRPPSVVRTSKASVALSHPQPRQPQLSRLSNLAPHPQRQLQTRRTPRTRHARRRVGERAEEALAEDQK